MSNLYQMLDEVVQRNPKNAALVFQGHDISYASLKDAVDRLAYGFNALGLKKEDRLALMLPNVPHFVITFFAAARLGITIVPISIHYKEDEIHHQIEDAEVNGIVFWEGFRDAVVNASHDLATCKTCIVLGKNTENEEHNLLALIEKSVPLDESIDLEASDTATIVYTAGSAGRPRGAELTHENLISNARACSEFLHLSQNDKVIGAMPFFHPLGFTLVQNAFLYAGASILMKSKFNPQNIISTIESDKPSYMIGVPSMYRELIKEDPENKVDFSSLRACLSSGDAMDQETVNVYEEVYKVQMLEGYGLTEASPMVSFNSPNGIHKAGSIGLPLHGIDMKIVDEAGAEIVPGQIGEIIVQGPNVMKGYLNRPQATKEAMRNGWLYTGDFVKLDESGHAFLVVRQKNVIIKSGFNVYPREVEKFLLGHPKIKEAAVIGIPDDVYGETIHACIVLKEEGDDSTAGEIEAYSRERMAAYKCPTVIHFYESLPKGPTGRVLRDKLKKDLMDELNAEEH